jgi:putative aminopeptidase FrvX
VLPVTFPVRTRKKRKPALGRGVRYTHAHNGVMDRSDFDRTVNLVVALIKRLDAGTVKRLRDFSP